MRWKASGIIVSATMARMPPAATAVITAMVAAGAPSSNRLPSEAAAAHASAMPVHTPKT